MRVRSCLGLLLIAATGMACTTQAAVPGSSPSAGQPSSASLPLPVPTMSAPTTGEAPGLVWAPGRLPASLVSYVARRSDVAASVAVANGTAWLTSDPRTPKGMAIPIDVSAANPRLYASMLGPLADALSGLAPGDVGLASDEARLRRVKIGEVVHFGNRSLRVSAIVADAILGGAEMFVSPAEGQRLGLPARRYLLVRLGSDSDWPTVAPALRRHVPPTTPLRLRAPGAARRLREGDAVLPPLIEKLWFGEFAADPSPAPGGYLTIDPRWRSAHLVTASVPVLGRVTCNRAFIAQVRAALREVVARGLASLIHPNDYGGCWAPRLIPGLPGESISHHAYGSAIDINVSMNEQGSRPRQDPRLVAIFVKHGLTWGGRWLVPDGMHFETLSQPPRS